MESSFRIARSLDGTAGFGPSAVTIGNFDGVHLAHRRLIDRVVAIARERGLKAAALMFHPHPATVVAPERAPLLLTTPEQRAELMRSLGIEEVLILPFDTALAHMSPRQFIEQVLVERLGARAVVVGENFRFGNLQAGTPELLREAAGKYGFETEFIGSVRIRGKLVSSTEVRRQASLGHVSAVCRLLGRPFALQGRVVRGKGVGSKRTVPTLNLEPSSEVLPARGVYITRTKDSDSERQWDSVTNVGYRPTFGGEQLTVETFLLSPFDGQTPARIQLDFLWRLRDEKKFYSAELLKQQIFRDVTRARRYFARLGTVASAALSRSL
ncbi:MAG: bifunctional riboflavin kinase/FAD synthetase [Bryobacterales bacterium]|nr:bifunctional riboflavin kinase/FAD synthetase [Bryobacterales bacterium]